MKGQNVCRMHGGAAPAARRRAAERIALASDKAAAQLFAFMTDTAIPPAVRLAATKDLLDRAQVTGKTTVEIEVPVWQQILDGIVATVPGDGEAAMRPFAEARDPLVIEAERADQDREIADELTRYQAEPHGEDWSDDFAYGHDLPSGRPVQSHAGGAVQDREPAMPKANGDDRPPPRHPLPERRRIEPEDDRQPYRPTPRPPRRGRVAGRR
ncbi:hypothetical protein DQ237_11390 [Blastococcus sp. TF02-8]|nr:hypothetical protein DQ237_11390 [Blastococcus sp. TF02-8]